MTQQELYERLAAMVDADPWQALTAWDLFGVDSPSGELLVVSVEELADDCAMTVFSGMEGLDRVNSILSLSGWDGLTRLARVAIRDLADGQESLCVSFEPAGSCDRADLVPVRDTGALFPLHRTPVLRRNVPFSEPVPAGEEDFEALGLAAEAAACAVPRGCFTETGALPVYDPASGKWRMERIALDDPRKWDRRDLSGPAPEGFEELAGLPPGDGSILAESVTLPYNFSGETGSYQPRVSVAVPDRSPWAPPSGYAFRLWIDDRQKPEDPDALADAVRRAGKRPRRILYRIPENLDWLAPAAEALGAGLEYIGGRPVPLLDRFENAVSETVSAFSALLGEALDDGFDIEFTNPGASAAVSEVIAELGFSAGADRLEEAARARLSPFLR